MSGKNILVISSSPRRRGNSDLLADAFIEGAQEAGHTVEKISLHDKRIGFCRGCLGCQKTQRCILRDDMDDILPRMQQAEVIVFASPVYFYSLCGQLKTLLDRTNPLFAGDYAFRDISLLARAADTDEKAMEGPKKALEGWVVCFEKARLCGVVQALGVTEAGDIRRTPAALDAARDLGRGIR